MAPRGETLHCIQASTLTDPWHASMRHSVQVFGPKLIGPIIFFGKVYLKVYSCWHCMLYNN